MTGMAPAGRQEGEDEGGGQPAGGDERGEMEEGGGVEASEPHLVLVAAAEQKRERDEAVAKFPGDFRGYEVGNERSCSWNSGVSDGIRAEFQP
jgi:hypothetical protein